MKKIIAIIAAIIIFYLAPIFVPLYVPFVCKEGKSGIDIVVEFMERDGAPPWIITNPIRGTVEFYTINAFHEERNLMTYRRVFFSKTLCEFDR